MYIISFRLFTLHKSIIVKKYIFKKPDSPINGQVSAIRHVPIPTCSISSLFYHAVFFKNLNEHEVCLSMPLMRYLSQLLYWHNVYNRVRIGFWWRIFLSIASLFLNSKKKVWTVGLKRRPVVETGSENESYTIKWQYDMIPSCKITASRKKTMSCIVRCVQKERHFDHRYIL